METEAATYFDQVSRYYMSRGKIISKIAKYPHVVSIGCCCCRCQCLLAVITNVYALFFFSNILCKVFLSVLPFCSFSLPDTLCCCHGYNTYFAIKCQYFCSWLCDAIECVFGLSHFSFILLQFHEFFLLLVLSLVTLLVFYSSSP